ncbi:hypothetical protein MANES_14G140600v8 [Manihot esculenta]|uniref:P-type ATPase A domain-containing protein n=1 Tax=Manihot esculenta TaxID=3983 RepID=A0A2C9ULM1_MANES|nr:hypothetical protein MANES_14G140600v8 [Manihot esculenta]
MVDISLKHMKNENVDFEKNPVEEVFQQLKCTKEAIKENKFRKFLGFMWNPISWVMESAAIMAIVLASGGGKPPNWQDFLGILVLLLMNSTISLIEENYAGNAAAALMAGLATKTKVIRDGKWSEQKASILVPEDLISIKLGDFIPADAHITFTTQLVNKVRLRLRLCIGTGVHTFFGKAGHLVDNTNNVGHFQQVLTAIGNFCICSIATGMIIEIVVMYPIQHRNFREGINTFLVLLIGGIPIAMSTVLSVTMAIGYHRLSQQGAITKRMTAIEEMVVIRLVLSPLTSFTVDKNLIEVFANDMDKDTVVLLAARASRIENQDAIGASIVGMLRDLKESRIYRGEFFAFQSCGRTAITYIDSNAYWHRCNKGDPEQIIDLCELTGEMKIKAHEIIDNFAERGLLSLAVARQIIPEKTKESTGGPWEFVGLLPVIYPSRHDSAGTIRRALTKVKMITGDQLAIGKETSRRLGMGSNMYPASSLLGDNKDESIASIPVHELIKQADGFAGVFPDIGIAVAAATDAARSASDIVLTEAGLSVIRMKNYTIYVVSITIRTVMGFMLVALIWKFEFSPFMVLIIAILNDGTIMTISKDRVKPSPMPDSWKLKEIFATGIVLGA